jgi:hypothetical protein
MSDLHVKKLSVRFIHHIRNNLRFTELRIAERPLLLICLQMKNAVCSIQCSSTNSALKCQPTQKTAFDNCLQSAEAVGNDINCVAKVFYNRRISAALNDTVWHSCQHFFIRQHSRGGAVYNQQFVVIVNSRSASRGVMFFIVGVNVALSWLRYQFYGLARYGPMNSSDRRACEDFNLAVSSNKFCINHSSISWIFFKSNSKHRYVLLIRTRCY